ncbi:MAG: nitroreductase [Erysipelotrichaceae bacterium]|nr:nitroreductase [Erysipelotrichaceae bacterium]
MNMNEAIYERHTVHKYMDKPLSGDIVALLNERVNDNNEKYGLNIKLMTNNSDGVSSMAKISGGKNINNYFILAGKDTPDLDEKLGYCGADIVLYAQTLGLNTWWIGGMVSKKGVKKHLGDESLRNSGVIVVGYGAESGKPHKSKTAQQVSSYDGEAPGWFNEGIKALLQAPTAMNKQAFSVKGHGNKVSITCSNKGFSGIDLGIGKYHFELGAGKDNFDWE